MVNSMTSLPLISSYTFNWVESNHQLIFAYTERPSEDFPKCFVWSKLHHLKDLPKTF